MRLSRLRRWLRPAILRLHVRRITSDRASSRTLYRLIRASPDTGPRGARVSVGLTALGGRTIDIRTGTSDAQVVWDTFVGRYHAPPASVAGSARRVWDLGANIGLTALDLAELCPHASLTAVELDAGNAELAGSNIATIDHRCGSSRGRCGPRMGASRTTALLGTNMASGWCRGLIRDAASPRSLSTPCSSDRAERQWIT